MHLNVINFKLMEKEYMKGSVLMSEYVLYKPIEDMFAKKGYFSISSRKKLPNERVHSPFGVNVHGATKKIDVVAFREIDGEIDARAVECKYGRTWEAAGEALGQATAYQRLFPKVYVATQAEEEDLKHVEPLLRQLGLGYISVKDDEPEELFPPSHNIRFNQKEFELQVKCKATTLLTGCEVLGRDNFQFGSASEPYYIWISSLEPCNVSLEVKNKIIWFGLNLESKSAVRRIFSRVQVGKLYKLLSELPSDYVLWLAKFTSYRPKRHEQEEIGPVSELKPLDVAAYIDKIKKWNWEAHIMVQKEREFDVLSKTIVEAELQKSITELSPLQRLFNYMVLEKK